MSVLDSLAREHRLFERLIEQLRRAIESSSDAAYARIAEASRTLLAALERHDAIEDLVFGDPGASSGADERRVREMVQAQHVALKALREDIEELLHDPSKPLSRLKGLAELLAGRLEWHFKTEEMLLWPIQARACGSPVGHSLERRAEKSVRELETEVERLRSSPHAGADPSSY